MTTSSRPAELERGVITERYAYYQDDFRVVSVFENRKLFFLYVEQFVRVPSRKSGGHWRKLSPAAKAHKAVMAAHEMKTSLTAS